MTTGKNSSADTGASGDLQVQSKRMRVTDVSGKKSDPKWHFPRDWEEQNPLPETEICLVNRGMGKNSVYRNSKSS